MEFLLENPFILVVIIGIISSFYKQMKGTGEDEQKRKRQPKPFVPGQPDEKSKPFIDFDFGEIQKRFESTKTNVQKPVEKELRNTQKVQESKSVPRKESFQNTQRLERQATGRLNQPRIEKKVSKESDSRVTSQTLRDAVVWAEILGPPRAKQIHNRKRANTRY